MTRTGLQILGGLAACVAFVFGGYNEAIFFAALGALSLCVIIDMVMHIRGISEDDTLFRGNVVLAAVVPVALLVALVDIPKGAWASYFSIGVFVATGLIFATWFFCKISESAEISETT